MNARGSFNHLSALRSPLVVVVLPLLFLILSLPSTAVPPARSTRSIPPPIRADSPVIVAAETRPAGPPTVTLNLQDIEVRELVRILGEQSGITIYADPSVKGTASLNVANLAFEDAMRVILEPRGYVFQRVQHSAGADSFGYYIYDPATTRRLFIALKDGLLTADIQRFQLSDVIAELARESRRSIVAVGDATAPITLGLQAVPFDRALGEIARAAGARVIIAGSGDSSVYRVFAGSTDTASGFDPMTAARMSPFEVTRLEDGKIRVRTTYAQLRDVLTAVAEAGNLSVLVGADVSATTTSYLDAITPRDAVQSLAAQAGLRVFTQDAILIVGSAQENHLSVQVRNDKLNILAYEAPVREALTRIALAGDLPALTFDPSVAGNVSLTLTDRPAREALQRVAEARGLRIDERGGNLRITDPVIEKRVRVVVQAGLVTMDVQNAPFHEVLGELSARTGVNVSAGRLDSTISLNVQSLTTPGSLRALADAVGLIVSEEVDRFRLVPKGTAPSGFVRAELTPEGMLSLECEDAQVALVARRLAEVSGRSFLVETGTVGSLSGRIESVPFDAGVRTFLASKGYRLRRTNGIFRIASGQTPQTAGEAAANFEIVVENGRISVDVTDADLGVLLRQIAEEAGLNLTLYGSIRDKVNVLIRNEALDTALARMLAGTRFGHTIADSTLTVGDITQPGPMAALALREEIIPLQYFSAKDIPALLPPEIPSGQVRVLEAQNAIMVLGRPEIIDRARKFIARLDQQPTQIQIEGLLVEYRTTNGFTYNLSTLNVTGVAPDLANISPSQGATSFTFTDLRNFNNPLFQASLTALVEKGEASIRARPTIATISGREARINVQSQENFRITQPSSTQGVPLVQIQSINSGITLRITPYVSADAGDAVTLDLFFEDSSPGDRTSDGLPAIATRNAQNRLVIRNDHTAVIGGLIRNDVSRSRGGFPILSQIPLIGSFFGRRLTSDRQSTLVFYITPRVITSDTSVAQTFSDRGVRIEPEALPLPESVPSATAPVVQQPARPDHSI